MGGGEIVEEGAEGEHHEELGEPVEGYIVGFLPETSVLRLLVVLDEGWDGVYGMYCSCKGRLVNDVYGGVSMGLS